MGRRCPYCQQILPEFRLGVRLTDQQGRIFDIVLRSGRDGIQGSDLHDLIYDGQWVRYKRAKPASRKALKSAIWHINQQIQRPGYRIICYGRNASSTYRLERVGP
jgi:hypothetical protein